MIHQNGEIEFVAVSESRLTMKDRDYQGSDLLLEIIEEVA